MITINMEPKYDKGGLRDLGKSFGNYCAVKSPLDTCRRKIIWQINGDGPKVKVCPSFFSEIEWDECSYRIYLRDKPYMPQCEKCSKEDQGTGFSYNIILVEYKSVTIKVTCNGCRRVSFQGCIIQLSNDNDTLQCNGCENCDPKEYSTLVNTESRSVLLCRCCSEIYVYPRETEEVTATGIDPINQLSKLNVGDHICQQIGVFVHHAIVSGVNQATGIVTLIHFVRPEDHASFDKCNVQEQKFNFQVLQKKAQIMRVRYNRNDCMPGSVVVAMARAYKSKYHLVENNCEHLAYFCKTGSHWSNQVNRVLRLIGERRMVLLVDIASQSLPKLAYLSAGRRTSGGTVSVFMHLLYYVIHPYVQSPPLSLRRRGQKAIAYN